MSTEPAAGQGSKGFGWVDYHAFTNEVFEAYVMRALNPVPKPTKPEPPKIDFSKFQCAKLELDTSTGKSILKGFVSTDQDLEDIKSALATTGTKLNIDVRPWPQCEILLSLDKELAAEHRTTIKLNRAQTVLKSGENFSFSIEAPDQPAFLYVSYVSADGTVVTLHQSPSSPPAPAKPHEIRMFGDGEGGRDRFTISAPFGNEMIVVVASRSPLFEGALADTMTEREYLTKLRSAIIYKPSPDMPDRDVSAAIIPIKTSEK